ncbi:hypothetical protein CHS0354_013007 [Potamilus streckersoni]|uniref:Uncharacterized protein n=2 Tax=Potamilus streckersoni TaxID=2493646 RepID=A0AAE0T7C8_9BIVA|nr:hypothetical protein CHS0354_013007 [Potamilus streckersoni]
MLYNKFQEPLTPLETYAINLKKYYHLSQSSLGVVDPLVKEDIRKKISGVEQVLRCHERSLKLTRWSSTSEQYKMHTESSNRKTVSAKVQVMKRLMAERTFLLQMMKKYARGQAVAVRLGRQLQKVNTAVQHHLKEYNLLEGSKMPYPDKLDLDSLKSLEVLASVPEELQRLLIDLYETKERCEEEIELIACDMRSTNCFYMKQQEAVLTSFERAESDVHRAVLLLEGLNIERCILHLRNMSSNVSIVNEVPLHFHKKLQLDLLSVEQEIPSILGNLVSDEYLLEQLDEEGSESMDSYPSSDKADDIEMDI